MIAIGGDGVVTRLNGRQGADAHRFLATVKMQINAGDAFFLVEFVTGFLELANQDHLPVPVQQNITIGKRGAVCVIHCFLRRTRRERCCPARAHALMEAGSIPEPDQCTLWPLCGQSRGANFTRCDRLSGKGQTG